MTKLQQRFQQHLLEPDADALADVIVETPQVPRATRLHIYSNAYRERMVEALDSDYHQLHVFLGDEEFSRLIYAYLAAHPSRQPSLRWFGAHLPEFLHRTRPYSGHPELAELAEFEWALCHAFDTADAPLVDLAQLMKLAPEELAGLKLGFHSSLQELLLHCAAPTVWQALNENAEATPPPFNWKADPDAWLVWRQELRLMFRPAEADEAWALEAFRSGKAFGDVCEGLCQWHAEEQVPTRAVGLLQTWLNEQLVIKLQSS
ncbi:MAG: DNA-binding domain-containing protein [Xanthomonadales bacterium]|nr:DNA-binding domain-containing protein [Xanthomonadales bacterium]